MNEAVAYLILAGLGVLAGLVSAVLSKVLRKRLPALAFILMLACGVVAVLALVPFGLTMGWAAVLTASV